jgi:hypothetical protein
MALDMGEPLGGKLLDSRMKRLHPRSIAAGVYRDIAAGMRSTIQGGLKRRGIDGSDPWNSEGADWLCMR